MILSIIKDIFNFFELIIDLILAYKYLICMKKIKK